MSTKIAKKTKSDTPKVAIFRFFSIPFPKVCIINNILSTTSAWRKSLIIRALQQEYTLIEAYTGLEWLCDNKVCKRRIQPMRPK